MPIPTMLATFDQRTAALTQLGVVMAHLARSEPWPGHGIGLDRMEYDALDAVVRGAYATNGWFTEENVRHAFGSWADALDGEGLKRWCDTYPALSSARSPVRTVGIILAGNIPLVGLHDVLSVWLAGHRAKVKCSSQDPALIPGLIDVLERFVPGTATRITFSPGRLGEVEAMIATGSNNTARYFEHYFGHLPRIIRKSRTSVAVLDGTETPEELASLGEDVFRYFGLGCRNVSKLYVPNDFELDRFFTAVFPWKDIVLHNKYGNNYDYTRALWMLDGVKFLENGFLLVKEDEALASPMASVFLQRYTDRGAVDYELAAQAESLQCIIGHHALPFGKAQTPGLADFADGVDTLRFLLDLK
jgi:hypothetical protein